MRSFRHVSPELRVFAGGDSLQRLERELARLNCHRAVVFCGETLSKGTLLGSVREAMGARCAGVYPGVRAHSPRPAVEAGAGVLRSLGADAVVALGGGSAVVTARAATIFAAEGGDLAALSTSFDADGRMHSPRLEAAKLPQLVVTTTPSTAMVKAGSAVFDPDSGRRFALFDPKTRARAVFVHPDLLMSAPRELVASACLDTLTLAIEGLTSGAGDPISDAHLMHALRLLSSDLPVLAARDDEALRGELAVAAILCGRGSDHTSAGAATVLGHAIGAAHEVRNGPVKAIVLPHVLRFNAEHARDGIARVVASMGLSCTAADEVAGVEEALVPLLRDLGVPRRLRDLGVPEEALPGIAGHAMDDWFLRGNPRPVREARELLEVLRAAW